MSLSRSVAEVLHEHVTLEVEGIDRMYLNVYVPALQRAGGVAPLDFDFSARAMLWTPTFFGRERLPKDGTGSRLHSWTIEARVDDVARVLTQEIVM